MTIVSGPNLHPMLVKKAEEVADKWRIPYTREICSGVTGTDAAAIQIARGGIPTILLSVPLRYMHTSVETGVISVIEDVGKLIALFIEEIAREWEDLKWY
jgi:endoglucanase